MVFNVLRQSSLESSPSFDRYPVPKQCEIYVGSEDWQSNPENVTAMGSMLGINVTVVPDAGHRLPKDYVGSLLDRWLDQPRA